MPEGVDVVVEDGFATIEPGAQRGVVAAQLLEHTPPDLIEKLTRPRHAYRVPEQYARAAGLVDELANADGPQVLTPGPDETPDESWKVDELKAYAEQHNIDLGDATKKADILDAIRAAEAATAP